MNSNSAILAPVLMCNKSTKVTCCDKQIHIHINDIWPLHVQYTDLGVYFYEYTQQLLANGIPLHSKSDILIHCKPISQDIWHHHHAAWQDSTSGRTLLAIALLASFLSPQIFPHRWKQFAAFWGFLGQRCPDTCLLWVCTNALHLLDSAHCSPGFWRSHT